MTKQRQEKLKGAEAGNEKVKTQETQSDQPRMLRSLFSELKESLGKGGNEKKDVRKKALLTSLILVYLKQKLQGDGDYRGLESDFEDIQKQMDTHKKDLISALKDTLDERKNIYSIKPEERGEFLLVSGVTVETFLVKQAFDYLEGRAQFVATPRVPLVPRQWDVATVQEAPRAELAAPIQQAGDFFSGLVNKIIGK